MNPAFPILSLIDSPEDLRKLSVDRLPALCDELRRYIIKEVSENPGHLGASLGTVELTVALHYVLNTPEDRIVWDVGHQAYGHKILTGRRERFHTNRKQGGLSGFPHPDESPYDAFIAGHASNSVSAALGLSIAARRQDKNRLVAAVIGDGAMTGGLAFEGLNNTAEYDNDLLIVLNDNNYAIDRNIGGLSRSLTRISTSRHYNNVRWRLYLFFKKIGLINESRKSRILRMSNALVRFLGRHAGTIFDGLDIRYFGPVDGHDVKRLVQIIGNIKDMKGPKVLHILTTKGKGYEPAERNATRFHAPGVFDILTGESPCDPNPGAHPVKFQDVFGLTLTELAEQNPRIVAVTPAMPTGCGLHVMMDRFPDRVFDVGIAEGHAITFSAGLAKDGLLPFCNIYSSFAQRAFDNIIHDVAISKLPVVICLDRAGLVGEDGATHQGAFDMASLRCVPNLCIASPIDEVELRHLMFTAQHLADRPFVIRYPRGKGFVTHWKQPMELIPIGKGRCLHPGTDLAIASIGPIGLTALRLIEQLDREEGMPSVALYDFRFLKPLDRELAVEIGQNFDKLITLENGAVQGGFGSALLEVLADEGYHPRLKRLGLPDRFIEHASVTQQHEACGLDTESLRRCVLEMTQPDGKTPDGATPTDNEF